jgi:hypothetical protein
VECFADEGRRQGFGLRPVPPKDEDAGAMVLQRPAASGLGGFDLADVLPRLPPLSGRCRALGRDCP